MKIILDKLFGKEVIDFSYRFVTNIRSVCEVNCGYDYNYFSMMRKKESPLIQLVNYQKLLKDAIIKSCI